MSSQAASVHTKKEQDQGAPKAGGEVRTLLLLSHLGGCNITTGLLQATTS